MATKDYANRNPKGKKKPKGADKAKNGPAKKMPWLFAVVVFIAIFMFGYFLWSLKVSDSSTTPVVDSTPKATIKKQHKDALPPKPKEEWTYLETLENKKVEVDLPKPSNKPTRPYQIQCASFRLESQADELKAKIAFQGLMAQVRRVEGSTGVWYKVVLGPFERKRLAERQRHVLQRGGINGCQIWLWEG